MHVVSKQSDSPDDMGTTGSSWSAAEIENFSQGRGIPAERVDGLAKTFISLLTIKQVSR